MIFLFFYDFCPCTGHMAAIAQHTAAPCQSFAFPNGNYTAQLAKQALGCGARTVMTTEPTWVRPDMPLWWLPRIQVHAGFSCRKIQMKLLAAATTSPVSSRISR